LESSPCASVVYLAYRGHVCGEQYSPAVLPLVHGETGARFPNGPHVPNRCAAHQLKAVSAPSRMRKGAAQAINPAPTRTKRHALLHGTKLA